MCYRSLILVTVLLFCLGEVCARPISNTPKRRSADYGGEDDGWPRVEGGRLKKCKTAGCPKLDGPPVTLHEEIKMTHVATLTVTVDSLVVVTEYVDATVSSSMHNR